MSDVRKCLYSNGFGYIRESRHAKFRKAMFTLSSSHRLMVEKGRYYNLSREQRTRPYCETILEEEFHFVCPLYKDLRVKYLPSYFVNNVSLETFMNLCLPKMKRVLSTMLCTYIMVLKNEIYL